MAIEIEKKYRLTREQRAALLSRLADVRATPHGEAFEENILYGGGRLDLQTEVLRLRRAGGRAILTYKQRFAGTSAVRHNREEETVVEDAQALTAILEALGFTPALVYEKRRATWHVAGVEVALDELPFGLYLEIEGDEQAIAEAETLLDLSDTEAEPDTYPELARRHGEQHGNLIEARFQMRLPET